MRLLRGGTRAARCEAVGRAPRESQRQLAVTDRRAGGRWQLLQYAGQRHAD